MQIEFIKNWKYAHRGIHVEEFEAGDIRDDLSDEICKMAVDDGAAKPKGGKPKASSNKTGDNN